MAITIAANLAKKLPIPGSQFSSQQASITITAEVADLNQVAAEAQRLYLLAERAIDSQLGVPAPQDQAASQVSVSASPTAPVRPLPSQPAGSSRPYRPGPGPRRAPVPVTDSQLRYLRRLIEETHTSLPAILAQHQVGSLEHMSCKDAAGLIDELKAAAQVSA